MEKKEMIQLARTAIDKNMDFETLKYSDYLYGKEHLVDDVWEYVVEAEEQGMNWFQETYAQYLN